MKDDKEKKKITKPQDLYCKECGKITPHTPKMSAVKDECQVCTVCSSMNLINSKK